MIREDDPRIEAGHRAISAYWDAIGPSDPDVISYVLNPQFAGKPAWPNTRQAYRIVRPRDALIIASDGLSDPFVGTDKDDVSGFGMEVVGADFDTIRSSWAFRAIENFAMNVAAWGGIAPQLSEQTLLSTEFPAVGMLPSDWLSERGTAGFLINLPSPGRARDVAMPFGPVLVVALTLLHPAELQFVIAGGRAGRAQLAQKLGTAGSGHLSSIRRASVV